MNLKMTEKKTRLLCEDDVIKAVDKHTNDDGSLDDDISCILEEVKSVSIIGSKKAMENMKVEYSESKLPKTSVNIPMPKVKDILPETNMSLTMPRVFMFNLKDENIDHSKVQKDLKRQISEGCLVIPDCVEFIGIENPIVVLH